MAKKVGASIFPSWEMKNEQMNFHHTSHLILKCSSAAYVNPHRHQRKVAETGHYQISGMRVLIKIAFIFKSTSPVQTRATTYSPLIIRVGTIFGHAVTTGEQEADLS